jgi:hypothetical protein
VNPEELLPHQLMQRMADFFEAENIPYRVVGSMASMIYGEPRFTNDVDMVADIPMGKVSQFCNAFQPPEYYVSESAIREAIQKRFQFNLLHPQSGLKVDIIIPHNTDYALVAASRVLRKSSKGEYDALFGSPEDVILNKLIYFQLGGGVGEKHLRDIAGILKLQKENLDLKYLDEWAARLGVSAEWSLVQKHVGNKGI